MGEEKKKKEQEAEEEEEGRMGRRMEKGMSVREREREIR